MNAQSVFDLGYKTFIIENKPPCVNLNTITGNLQCRYKDGDSACIVGLSLTAEQIDQLIDMPLLRLLNRLGLPERDINLICTMQHRLHDSLASWNGSPFWLATRLERKQIYEQFASRYGLTVPV